MGKIKFICNAIKWFDRVNGNTYHSVRVTRCEDGAVFSVPYQYGYGDHYRQTALEGMFKAGWLQNIKRKEEGLPVGKVDYTDDTLYLFERENDYPIAWNVSNGLKRECKTNGIL